MSGMPLGVEMMIKSVIKMLGLDPVKVTATIEDIRNALQNSASDLRRIRENQKIIMAHFGLDEWRDNNVGSGLIDGTVERNDNRKAN